MTYDSVLSNTEAQFSCFNLHYITYQSASKVGLGLGEIVRKLFVAFRLSNLVLINELHVSANDECKHVFINFRGSIL